MNPGLQGKGALVPGPGSGSGLAMASALAGARYMTGQTLSLSGVYGMV